MASDAVIKRMPSRQVAGLNKNEILWNPGVAAGIATVRIHYFYFRRNLHTLGSRRLPIKQSWPQVDAIFN